MDKSPMDFIHAKDAVLVDRELAGDAVVLWAAEPWTVIWFIVAVFMLFM